MAGSFKKTDRVAEQIQRKLAQLIQQEVKDPRLPGFITVSSVDVSHDLSHAKVFFTVFNADHVVAASILNTAAGYLRSSLAKSMKTRTVPQLRFIYDSSLEYGQKLSRLIDEANPADPNEDSDS